MTATPSRFTGVIVPLVTPTRDDGSLALEVLPQLLDFLLNAGVAGVVVAGTTGEGYALDMDERALLLHSAVDAVGGRVPVLAGVGGTSTREAQAQAQLACAAGVHGLMIAAPAYCLPTGHELGEHVLQVLSATSLPTVLYDYPERTGVQFGVDALDLLVGNPLVVGIKEASGDLSRIAMLHARYGDDLALVSGSDLLAMHYFESGSDCWIAGFANALPAEHVAMLAAAQRGDIAEGWGMQNSLEPILTALERDHYVARTRFALSARGISVGPPRAPLLPLGADDSQAMTAHLVALGHLASP